VKKIVSFGFQRHRQGPYRSFLPLLVVFGAVLMVAWMMSRGNTKKDANTGTGENLSWVGLQPLRSDPVSGVKSFDPQLAIPSPIDLVLAPLVTRFDAPMGGHRGAFVYNAQPFLTGRHLGDDLNGIGGQNSDLGDPVFAVADGLVLTAAWPSDGWGNVVTLLHELPDGRLIETFYGHLDRIAVPVGQRVRRGDQLGTVGNANGRYLAHLHLEFRECLSLPAGTGYADGALGRISGERALIQWRGAEEDQLAGPVSGSPAPSGSLSIQGDPQPIEKPITE
jgi:murein DD-endopeptidase MepM/ murein hydrolase activator NlpD